jgi:N-acetylmuramic acid 6-phosphate etherase
MLPGMPPTGQRLIVGLMSGTSCDGVDAAVVAIWGRGLARSARLWGHLHLPFAPELRRELLEARSAGSLALARLAQLTSAVTECHATATTRLLAAQETNPAQIAAIGAHGQTLFHRPPYTMQILDPALLAARTGIMVVSDFRRADCALGGQGAPLVPLADYLLLRDPRHQKGRVIINIGGIANCTVLPAAAELDQVRAWDAGPGNCIIDHLLRRADGPAFDDGGKLALTGRENAGLIQQVLADDYFARLPPKSTDGPQMIAIFERAARDHHLSLPNALASACALTAAALVDSIVRETGHVGRSGHAPELICSGGGTRNAAIMGALRRRAAERLGAVVRTSDELGIPSDAKEAIAFALLASCTLDGEPGNVPSVTGASGRAVLGTITPPPMRQSVTPAAVPASPPPLPPPDDRSALLTEQRLPESMSLDSMSLADALELLSAQDQQAVAAVQTQHDTIAAVIEIVADRLSNGGRLFYCGAGTSGRLGVLDAAECPPTFRTDPQMVQAIIAGGEAAVFAAVEGAEDDAQAGAAAVELRSIGPTDVLIGIAAGGTTPFVIGALGAARKQKAATALICCVQPRQAEPPVDVVIRPLTGPEVVTGSTRLKAGTATKLVLNAITTLAMVRLGKVHENLMVDLRATNQKLWDRGARLVALLTGLERAPALDLLRKADGSVKVAVLMQRRGWTSAQAQVALNQAAGALRAALQVESQS